MCILNIFLYIVNFSQINEYCNSVVLCDTSSNLTCNNQTNKCECSIGFRSMINNCTNFNAINTCSYKCGKKFFLSRLDSFFK